jgi:tetratricopeptide (TPR) repeat protein
MANTNEPDPRSPVDWRARQKRQKIAGTIKLLLVVAILGAVVGLGIRFYPNLKELISPTQQAQVPPPPPAKQPEAVKEPPPPAKVIETPKELPKQQVAVANEKPVAKAAEFQVVEAEEQRAKELIELGQQAIIKTDFTGARKVLDEAAQLRATRETHQTAQKMAHKAEQFDLATSHVKPSDFAKAETSWVIEMRDGGTFRGLLSNEQPETITLTRVSEENPASTGTVTTMIPRMEIQKKRQVPLVERQKEFLEFLAQLESAMALGPDAKATDYYDLVVLSRRLALNDKCLAYLETAYQKAPDHALGTLFRKLIIDRALERATLLAAAGRKIQAESVLRELTNRTLPGYAKAADAADAFRVEVLSKIRDDFRSTIALKAKKEEDGGGRPSKPTQSARALASAATSSDKDSDASVEIVIVNEGVTSSNAKANQFVQQGNKFYEDGMSEYKKYRQGTQGNNNAVLKAAMAKLEKAVDLYGQALDIDKSNKSISDRQVEANMIVYACKKYQTL